MEKGTYASIPETKTSVAKYPQQATELSSWQLWHNHCRDVTSQKFICLYKTPKGITGLYETFITGTGSKDLSYKR